MSTTSLPTEQPGRTAAFLVYVLYLLSIPSAGIFALIGVIVALASRDGASPLARSHLDDQIRVWFIAFWWAVGLAIIGVIGWILVPLLGLGLLVLWAVWLTGALVCLWFIVKSVLGLVALLDNRAR
jgi:uncharacterized membrane protein